MLGIESRNSRPLMTKSKINKAISHLDLIIEGTRGDGYFYFLDLEGNQIGESVCVCYLNQLSLEQWVKEAEFAREHHEEPSKEVLAWLF